MTSHTQLLPGLPNDVALDCLIRVPFDQFSTVASVCKGWKTVIQHPEFRRRRNSAGLALSLIAMVQTRVDSTIRKSEEVKFASFPAYRLVLCDPRSGGSWSELPPLPEFSDALPMFCQLVSVGLKLVVLGGYHPVTWEALNSVYVYDFVSAKWNRGVDMPGGARSFFGASSDSETKVFVAGGHDGGKNALRSAMLYDVAEDEWVLLPDMARQRDECKGVFHGGKFHVIGGYQTEMQGRFESTAEAFDVSKWMWDPVKEEFLGAPSCPRTCVDGGDATIHMCRDGNLVALDNANWKVLAELPAEVANVACLTAWQDMHFVSGCAKFGEAHKAYVINPKNTRWTKLEAPEEYTGHVQSGCCLNI